MRDHSWRPVRRATQFPTGQHYQPKILFVPAQMLADHLVLHRVLGVSGPVDRWLEAHSPRVGSRRRAGQC